MEDCNNSPAMKENSAELKAKIEEGIKILKKIPREEGLPSNCHGTTRFLLGFDRVELPQYVDYESRTGFLRDHCRSVEKPREADIATIWSKVHKPSSMTPREERLEHSGIVVHPQSGRVYHQKDEGDVFEFSTVQDYLRSFPSFQIKRQIFPKFFRYVG